MPQRPPIYLVDTTAQQVDILQTVLHFVGEAYQTVAVEQLAQQVEQQAPLAKLFMVINISNWMHY